jgi:hypothetical protein
MTTTAPTMTQAYSGASERSTDRRYHSSVRQASRKGKFRQGGVLVESSTRHPCSCSRSSKDTPSDSENDDHDDDKPPTYTISATRWERPAAVTRFRRGEAYCHSNCLTSLQKESGRAMHRHFLLLFLEGTTAPYRRCRQPPTIAPLTAAERRHHLNNASVAKA